MSLSFQLVLDFWKIPNGGLDHLDLGGGGIFPPRLSVPPWKSWVLSYQDTLCEKTTGQKRDPEERNMWNHILYYPLIFCESSKNFKSGIPLTNISVKGITVEPLEVPPQNSMGLTIIYHHVTIGGKFPFSF